MGYMIAMFSSSSACSFPKIEDLVKQINEKPIYSLVIGFSQIHFYSLNHNFVHASLFLTTYKTNELFLEKNKNVDGILLEYGNYPLDGTYDKKIEDYEIKNGLKIYRYEGQGGLRYYACEFEYFIKRFGDAGYITLDISKENNYTFPNLIDKLAPLSENKWIKENYNMIGIFKKSQNSQDFVCHVIDILKPHYNKDNIKNGKYLETKSDSDKESIVPNSILKTLKKY